MDFNALDHDSLDSFEHCVLDTLAAKIGFEAAFIFCRGTTPAAVRLDVRQLVRALGDPTMEHELAPIKRAATAARGVAVDTEVLGELAVHECTYFRTFAEPIGGRHSLVALITLRGTLFGTMMLGRSGSRFSAAQIDQIEHWLPEICLSVSSYFASPPYLPTPLPKPPRTTMYESAASWISGSRIVDSRHAPSGSLHLLVRDRGGYREMIAQNNGHELVWTRASLQEGSESGWFYIDLLHLAAARAQSRSHGLFLGCGGGVVLRQFAKTYPQMSMDVVEPVTDVIDLARRWFGLDDIPRLRVHIDDGDNFISRAADAAWDVIVVDAYDGTELASPFASDSFYAHARRVLMPGGCMAFNVISELAPRSLACQLERLAQRHFSDVRLVPVIDPQEDFSPYALRNVVLVAR